MTSTMAPRQINEGRPNLIHAWGEHQVLQVITPTPKLFRKARSSLFNNRHFILFTPQLDESVVTPGFAYNLARYFPSGTHHDKEKCIEIMEKIGVSSDPATWYSTGAIFLKQ